MHFSKPGNQIQKNLNFQVEPQVYKCPSNFMSPKLHLQIAFMFSQHSKTESTLHLLSYRPSSSSKLSD